MMRTKFLRKYVLTYFMNIGIVRYSVLYQSLKKKKKKNSVDKT